jgi:zinc protease
VGSRQDGEQQGLTHYLEHVLFRGTQRRTTREIYGQIEALGGRINADTGKDNLSLSVVTGAAHWRTGLDVLSDILQHPCLDPGDFAAERNVIMTEIAARADMRQIIWDLYDLTLWQTHPLRHRVLGYASVVETLSIEDVAAHYWRFVVPPATLLVVCGDCDPAEVLDSVESLCADWGGDSPVYPPVPVEPPLAERRAGAIERSITQTHLVIGWPAEGLRHANSYVLKMIERILGVGGNSRLYRALREQQGLVYTVWTARAEHEDAGHFAVYTATDPARVEATVEAILGQIKRLQSEPVSDAELEAARMNYEGSMAVSFERNLYMAGIVGIETLLTGAFESFAEATRRVRAVTHEDILRVADQYLDLERYVTATVGPHTPSAWPATGLLPAEVAGRSE